MKIDSLIDRIDTLKPNPYDGEFIRNLIKQCNQKIYNSFFAEHKSSFESYKQKYLSPDTELLLPDEYESVYISYVMAHIDYYLGEYERYNNEMIMYNSKWSEFVSWYTRNHPSENIKIKIS